MEDRAGRFFSGRLKCTLALNIHGTLLHLLCDDRKLLQLIKRHLKTYWVGLEKGKKPDMACSIITLPRNDFDTVLGNYKRMKKIKNDEDLDIRYGKAGPEYVFGVNGECIILFNGSDDDCCCILLKTDDGGILEPMIFMDILLIEWLKNRGFYFIHASGVCSGGRAFLFIGPSGSGKSTASLIGAYSGLDFLGDDLIILKKSESGFYAYSYNVNVKVNRDIMEKMDYFSRPIFRGKKYDTLQFSLKKHFRVDICKKAPVEKIYFIKKNNPLCVLSTVEAYPLLLKSVCFPGRDRFKLEHFQLFQDFLRSVKSFTVGHEDINNNFAALVTPDISSMRLRGKL